jgi:hypothetical protein
MHLSGALCEALVTPRCAGFCGNPGLSLPMDGLAREALADIRSGRIQATAHAIPEALPPDVRAVPAVRT